MKYIFSMKMAVLMLFLFGVIIGGATFIENDYGTQTARAVIYKTTWFELFLGYFVAILIYNIFKYKSYKNKLPVFLFHFSFLIIAIGALVTRYIGYEGIMSIREGQMSNVMVSDVKNLQVHATQGNKSTTLEKEVFFSTMTGNSMSESLKVGDKRVNIELLKYLPTVDKHAIASPEGKKLLELKISAGGKGKIYFLSKGEKKDFGSFYVGYETTPTTDKPTFLIKDKADGYSINFPFALKTLNMNDKTSGELQDGENDFKNRMLYRFGDNAVVLKEVHEKAVIKLDSHDIKTQRGQPEYMQWKVSVGDKSKLITTMPYKGRVGEINKLDLDGVHIDMRVGAKLIDVPFSIKLEDFELERYPGSMTPASYSSKVVLIDKEQNITKPYHIYMNHILDHRNYRFFQSSYDPDEKGTVLSVNHDPGTLPTYIGYLLLAIGMIWSLFHPSGRFQKLLKGARKLQASAAVLVTLFALSYTTPLQAAKLPTLDDTQQKMIDAYPKESVEKFGHIILQDGRGRMKPIDTLAHEIIAKLSGKSTIYGVEPTEMLLGMTVDPRNYQTIPMIKIDHPKIALDLGLKKDTKYAPFMSFFTKDGDYKLEKQINTSVRKKPFDKTAYDKELVKSDERLNIAYMVYTGSLLQLYPVPHDKGNKWMNPQDAISKLPKEISDMVRMMTVYLFQGATAIQEKGETDKFDKAINLITMYQKKFGAEVLPDEKVTNMEITYNRLGLLSKLVPLYILVGLILLLASFINIVKPNRSLNVINNIAWVLMIGGFIVHVGSMAMRWYIAGHAPWSNAYESIVFIAGSTIVAGLIFARKSPFTLGATALLAGITMGVAHLNFINPEITNLVPVLKSYWLMIHVATIISGDGFLGLGSMLSLLVLILFIMRKEGNSENIDRAIKELTNIAEMSLIVGLFLMTVGNFLGGVWANESWGRYWGWDSKETWAGVTILVYATILHLRFIPKLNNPFAFNVASLWGYSSVIMTYFGVNYYLSGLHSYAAGAPMPLPDWVVPSVIALFVLTLMSAKSMKNIKIIFMVLSPLILWLAGLLFMLR